MKGFALGLVPKQWEKAPKKRPIHQEGTNYKGQFTLHISNALLFSFGDFYFCFFFLSFFLSFHRLLRNKRNG